MGIGRKRRLKATKLTIRAGLATESISSCKQNRATRCSFDEGRVGSKAWVTLRYVWHLGHGGRVGMQRGTAEGALRVVDHVLLPSGLRLSRSQTRVGLPARWGALCSDYGDVWDSSIALPSTIYIVRRYMLTQQPAGEVWGCSTAWSTQAQRMNTRKKDKNTCWLQSPDDFISGAVTDGQVRVSWM